MHTYAHNFVQVLSITVCIEPSLSLLTSEPLLLPLMSVS